MLCEVIILSRGSNAKVFEANLRHVSIVFNTISRLFYAKPHSMHGSRHVLNLGFLVVLSGSRTWDPPKKKHVRDWTMCSKYDDRFKFNYSLYDLFT